MASGIMQVLPYMFGIFTAGNRKIRGPERVFNGGIQDITL